MGVAREGFGNNTKTRSYQPKHRQTQYFISLQTDVRACYHLLFLCKNIRVLMLEAWKAGNKGYTQSCNILISYRCSQQDAP